jgi:RNA polymerase sigma factor (sigma-70 family)
MRDVPSVILLVTRARAGDQQAWNALAERYAPLVWSICRRYQLGGADASDAGQNVWLNLVDQLGNIRDPAALPGWLATTTRRECGLVLRARRSPPAVQVLDAENIPGQHTGLAEHELLVAERHAALREAFADLPSRCQRLIGMLTEDPPVPYAKISAELGIPIGSIGPTRRVFGRDRPATNSRYRSTSRWPSEYRTSPAPVTVRTTHGKLLIRAPSHPRDESARMRQISPVY